MSSSSPLLLFLAAATAPSFICCIVSGYQIGMECEDNPELCGGYGWLWRRRYRCFRFDAWLQLQRMRLLPRNIHI